MNPESSAPQVLSNLTNDKLVEKAVERGEGEVASTGATSSWFANLRAKMQSGGER